MALSRKDVAHDPGVAAWLTILQAQSVMADALDRDLDRERGLPLAWFTLLVRLASAPQGRMKMQDLAHQVLLTKSGLTRLMDRMDEAGLVERQPCPEDRRAIYAVVTAAGRTALRAAIPVHGRSLTRNFTSHLSADELDALASSLRKVLDANGYTPPSCPTMC